MTLLTTDARYEGYPSKVAKLLRCMYPLSVTVRHCGRGVDLEKYYATLDG